MKTAAFNLYLIAILPGQTDRLKAIKEFLEIWEITEKKTREQSRLSARVPFTALAIEPETSVGSSWGLGLITCDDL